ncbi:GntR family transcriptional regulator [Mycobacterium sp. URHB0044]|jgi:GntR family transcriptional regulator of vanillate catabolism|uniref:GntR family transcriptional regulator n=1 Tax=Mycobacterium sp. URHB0044 TaxID=1380386 RepID=UPI0012DC2868|nr:GntR family transcriptional regulator [Mycobacterium sp. URHB0044]
MMVDPQSRVQTLSRTPRLVDEVVDHLRDAIIEGALPAGTPLPQVTLAAQLGVSRTPLREALRLLETEGLIRTSANNLSVEVVEVGVDDLRDMYQLREVVDGLAARLAAQRGLTPADEQRANALLHEMEASTEPYNPVLRSRAHGQFHELIALASGNARLESFVPLIRTSSAALYLPIGREHAQKNLLAANPDKTYKDILNDSDAQHHEIIAAIMTGDPQVAEAVARRHIQRTIDSVTSYG